MMACSCKGGDPIRQGRRAIDGRQGESGSLLAVSCGDPGDRQEQKIEEVDFLVGKAPENFPRDDAQRHDLKQNFDRHGRPVAKPAIRRLQTHDQQKGGQSHEGDTKGEKRANGKQRAFRPEMFERYPGSHQKRDQPRQGQPPGRSDYYDEKDHHGPQPHQV